MSNTQNKTIRELEKELEWYAATYENRKLVGILKTVIAAKIKKKNKNKSSEKEPSLLNKTDTMNENSQLNQKPNPGISFSDAITETGFDKEFYLNAYPDVKFSGMDPFKHYIENGWKEGRVPNDWFNPSLYLECNPDVKEMNIEPLTHYLNIGITERRNLRPSTPDYFDYLNQQNNNEQYKKEYIEYKNHEKTETDLKLIAFYLPQYHPIPENDKAWGKGFTEWTNVSKALPQFDGHYQPRLPDELGYYDLRLIEIQKRQIELAKNYGIHGFCYHYYWFDGKKVLDRPLQQVLDNPELDFPFCIDWANENWTKKWDGLDNDVIFKQHHTPSDDIKFLEAIRPILMDKRYIKVNNKPLLMIYRPQLFPDIKATVKRWREHAKKIGIGDIYLVLTHSFDTQDPREIGFDAATEFAPNGYNLEYNMTKSFKAYNPDYKGEIYNYCSAMNASRKFMETEYVKFRGICPGWDNEARKPGKSVVLHNSTPANYKTWLEFLCYNTDENKKIDEKIIFINAWNEWAEAAYLEPDRKYGYAFLEATCNVLKKFDKKKLKLLKQTHKLEKKSDIAVMLHLYYIDLWGEIKNELKNFKENFDLYININNSCTINDIENIKKDYPNAHIYSNENRGRDILPFLKTLELILPLNYKYICKLHSKKSPHRTDGDEWRKSLIQGLIGSKEKIKQSIELLKKSDIGVVVAGGNIYSYKEWLGSNTGIVEKFAEKGNIKIPEDFMFPAGSIFWFKPEIFKGTENLVHSDEFPLENGQLDGTIAHAYERVIGLFCIKNNYRIVSLEQPDKHVIKNTEAANTVLTEQISDTAWFEMNCSPEVKINGHSYIHVPLLPPDEVQLRFTGRKSRENLEQAFEFYKLVLSKKPAPKSVLDFGGGWGRILRFFLREVNPLNLYLVDCLTDAVTAAKATNPPFHVIQTLPEQTCPLADNSIEVIYAFSVFSHLSETYSRNNLKDFNRMLKPGGIVVFTTRGKLHLNSLRKERLSPHIDQSDQRLKVLQSAPDLDLIEKKLNEGGFHFFPTGGGGELSNQFYGETWIGEKWIKTNYKALGYKTYEMIPEAGTIDQVTFILHK